MSRTLDEFDDRTRAVTRFVYQFLPNGPSSGSNNFPPRDPRYRKYLPGFICNGEVMKIFA